MIRTEEIRRIKSFLEKVNDVKLKEILGLADFSRAFSDHFNKTPMFNLDNVIISLRDKNVEKSQLITLCKVCDFIFREHDGYVPMIGDKKFCLTYDYISGYDNRFINYSVLIKSNFIDIDKLMAEKLSQFIKYDKVANNEIIVESCDLCLDKIVLKDELKNYMSKTSQQINFVGEEKELDRLIEIFEVVSKDFSSVAESYILMEYIKLILSLLPIEMKDAMIMNFTNNQNLLRFFESNNIWKLSELYKVRFFDVDIELVKEIAKIFDNNDFIQPRVLHNYLINSLKEKDQEYTKLRYYSDMTYNDIGIKLGVSRAGAQAAIVKVKERLLDDSRRPYLLKMYQQLLKFRDNDYFMRAETIDGLGVWKYLLMDIFDIHEYKKSSIYIVEEDVKRYCLNPNSDFVFVEKDKDAPEYEFEFIKNLPNIIKKKELSKYVESIIENSNGKIFKKDVHEIIELNYFDYNTIISKTKLNATYFIKHILETYYLNGLDVYDDKNIEAIRKLAKEIFNFSLDDYNDRYIVNKICSLSTLVGRGVWKYNSEQIELSTEMIEKINSFILSYPISAIPIKHIYEEFANELLEFGIENKYGLHGAIKKIINNDYKITRDYIYTDDSQTFVEIIADFIKNSKILVTKEVLEKNFPGFALGIMQRIVNTSSIVNMNGYYASLDNFNITDEEVANIKAELDLIVQDNEAHNTKNIFYRLKNKFNGLFNRIGINHYLQFYYITNKLFDNDFEFLRPFIAKKGVEIQDKETQLIEMIVSEGDVSVDRLRELSAYVGFFLESVMDLVIRNNDEIVFLNENTVCALNKIEIDEDKISQIDTILDKFMLHYECRYLADLSKFDEIIEILPFTNKWFLYSIISAYSTKYKVFRTSNVMARTELILAKEDFDIRELDTLTSVVPEIYDLEDLLDIEDLE